MTKLLFVAPLLAAFVLAGCNPQAPATGEGGLSNNPTVATIQQYAVQACGFLPAIKMVAGILASGNAAVATGSEIASLICAAATRKSAGRGAKPKVYGEALKGKFVR